MKLIAANATRHIFHLLKRQIIWTDLLQKVQTMSWNGFHIETHKFIILTFWIQMASFPLGASFLYIYIFSFWNWFKIKTYYFSVLQCLFMQLISILLRRDEPQKVPEILVPPLNIFHGHNMNIDGQISRRDGLEDDNNDMQRPQFGQVIDVNFSPWTEFYPSGINFFFLWCPLIWFITNHIHRHPLMYTNRSNH